MCRLKWYNIGEADETTDDSSVYGMRRDGSRVGAGSRAVAAGADNARCGGLHQHSAECRCRDELDAFWKWRCRGGISVRTLRDLRLCDVHPRTEGHVVPRRFRRLFRRGDDQCPEDEQRAAEHESATDATGGSFLDRIYRINRIV